MTTRTQISDLRRYTTLPGNTACDGSNIVLHGEYFEKFQTGTNTPAGQPLQDNFYYTEILSYNDPLTLQPGTSWACNLRGAGMAWGSLPQAWDSNDENKLLDKAWSKIKGNSFDGGTFLGEGKQALQFIGDTAHSIAKCAHHIRSGDLRNAARALGHNWRGDVFSYSVRGRRFRTPGMKKNILPNSAKFFSSAWLQLQYAWKPLLADVHDGAEAVASMVNKPTRTTIRLSHFRENSGNNIPGQSINALMNARARTTVWWKISFEKLPEISFPDRMGLSDPVNVLWELVPYSFVVDWFLPIGAYLEAHATSAHLRQLKAVKIVESRKITERWTSWKLNPDRAWVWSPNPGPSVDSPPFYKRTAFSRTILNSFPPFQIPHKPPLFELNSISHLVSGISLMVQRFL